MKQKSNATTGSVDSARSSVTRLWEIFNSSSLDAMIAPLLWRKVRELVNVMFSFGRVTKFCHRDSQFHIRRPSGPTVRSASCAAWTFRPRNKSLTRCSIHVHLSNFGSAVEKTYSREFHLPQQVSHDESAVSHEHANFSCAKTMKMSCWFG